MSDVHLMPARLPACSQHWQTPNTASVCRSSLTSLIRPNISGLKWNVFFVFAVVLREAKSALTFTAGRCFSHIGTERRAGTHFDCSMGLFILLFYVCISVSALVIFLLSGIDLKLTYEAPPPPPTLNTDYKRSNNTNIHWVLYCRSFGIFQILLCSAQNFEITV